MYGEGSSCSTEVDKPRHSSLKRSSGRWWRIPRFRLGWREPLKPPDPYRTLLNLRDKRLESPNGANTGKTLMEVQWNLDSIVTGDRHDPFSNLGNCRRSIGGWKKGKLQIRSTKESVGYSTRKEAGSWWNWVCVRKRGQFEARLQVFEESCKFSSGGWRDTWL